MPLILILLALTSACESSAQREAESLTGGSIARGKTAIGKYGCAACHTIPGIPDATSLIAPPLEHMANRTYVGGVVQNTPKNLIQWIQNPPAIDPKTAMPNLHVTLDDARDIASYLYTLK